MSFYIRRFVKSIDNEMIMNSAVRKIVLLAAACCLLPSLSAQEIRKFEIGVDATYGISLKKSEANRYGFDLFGGYKVNEHFSAGYKHLRTIEFGKMPYVPRQKALSGNVWK